MKEPTDAISYLEGFTDGKKQGIKEVVDWIEEISVGTDFEGTDKMRWWKLTEADFQAKLKEWDV